MNKLPTLWQVAKIQAGIKETKRLIEKEMSYSPDLRKPAYLMELYAHMSKLDNMLLTGEGLPEVYAK
jgi:hypothetical protein